MSIQHQLHEHTLRQRLATLLLNERAAVSNAWLARLNSSTESNADQTAYTTQIARFLSLLDKGLAQPDMPSVTLAANVDAALANDFPLIYRPGAQVALVETIAERLDSGNVDAGWFAAMHALIQRTLAIACAQDELFAPFADRLGELNSAAWALRNLHEMPEIQQHALQEAVRLVDAASSLIYEWEHGVERPQALVTVSGRQPAVQTPPSLLRFLQQTCTGGCVFSIDAGESDASWPDGLRQRPTAFIPLPDEDGCNSVLVVSHRPEGHFSHDDLLLLASWGNLVATAVRNARLAASERYLVNLLQSSIRQMVHATSSQLARPDDFVTSLLHVAEGLTHAEVLWARLDLDGTTGPRLLTIGALPGACTLITAQLADAMAARVRQQAMPLVGTLRDLRFCENAEAADCCHYSYAIAEIASGGKSAGMLCALNATPFSTEQVALLQTIAEQIGLGLESMERSTSNQRLLLELANVNYVSEALASTFDPQRIMTLISQAGSQALNAPVSLCGWCEDDGTIRVLPETAVGIPGDVLRQLQLTDNNQVIRLVLEKHQPITSRMLGSRALSAFPTLARLSLQDWVCVPMVVKPRARGIMLVGDTKPRDFTPRAIALLSTYANQAALAMENSLLYEQVDRQLQQMELLYKVTRSVSSSLDRKVIFHEILHAAREALQAQAALICLADDNGVQRVEASAGLPEEIHQDWRIIPGEGIIGTVALRGTPVASLNVSRDGRATMLRKLARDEHLTSSLTVPLSLHGSTLGTLTILSRDTREFTAAQTNLLLAIATEAAVAVQNVRAYDEERRRGEELRTLIGVTSRRVSTTLDIVQTLLDISRRTDRDGERLDRIAQRMDCVRAVQGVITDEAPTMADVHTAIVQLVNERCFRSAECTRRLDIRIEGAHPILPSYEATLLMLYLHEWLMAAMQATEQVPAATFAITFQQFGREVLVQIEDTIAWEDGPGRVNSGIIDLATRALQGSEQESTESNRHRVRLRFTRPSGD